MPSFDGHLAQAEKNERFYHSLDIRTSKFLDWAVTSLFYSALHYVDAYLAARVPPFGSHPDNHTARGLWIDRVAELSRIEAEYRWLRNYSESARYGLMRFTPQQVSDIYNFRFRAVKQHIRNLLNLPTFP